MVDMNYRPKQDSVYGRPTPTKKMKPPISETYKNSVQDQDNDDTSSSSHGKVVQFIDALVTEVVEIPRVAPDMKPVLFYNKRDFSRFQEEEQRRYDKLMMKQIQDLVEEKMKDDIERAKANGATEAELEAMMPQTPAQIFALLNGVSSPGQASGASVSSADEISIEDDDFSREDDLSLDQSLKDESGHSVEYHSDSEFSISLGEIEEERINQQSLAATAKMLQQPPVREDDEDDSWDSDDSSYTLSLDGGDDSVGDDEKKKAQEKDEKRSSFTKVTEVIKNASFSDSASFYEMLGLDGSIPDLEEETMVPSSNRSMCSSDSDDSENNEESTEKFRPQYRHAARESRGRRKKKTQHGILPVNDVIIISDDSDIEGSLDGSLDDLEEIEEIIDVQEKKQSQQTIHDTAVQHTSRDRRMQRFQTEDDTHSDGVAANTMEPKQEKTIKPIDKNEQGRGVISSSSSSSKAAAGTGKKPPLDERKGNNEAKSQKVVTCLDMFKANSDDEDSDLDCFDNPSKHSASSATGKGRKIKYMKKSKHNPSAEASTEVPQTKLPAPVENVEKERKLDSKAAKSNTPIATKSVNVNVATATKVASGKDSSNSKSTVDKIITVGSDETAHVMTLNARAYESTGSSNEIDNDSSKSTATPSRSKSMPNRVKASKNRNVTSQNDEGNSKGVVASAKRGRDAKAATKRIQDSTKSSSLNQKSDKKNSATFQSDDDSNDDSIPSTASNRPSDDSTRSNSRRASPRSKQGNEIAKSNSQQPKEGKRNQMTKIYGDKHENNDDALAYDTTISSHAHGQDSATSNSKPVSKVAKSGKKNSKTTLQGEDTGPEDNVPSTMYALDSTILPNKPDINNAKSNNRSVAARAKPGKRSSNSASQDDEKADDLPATVVDLERTTSSTKAGGESSKSFEQPQKYGKGNANTTMHGDSDENNGAASTTRGQKTKCVDPNTKSMLPHQKLGKANPSPTICSREEEDDDAVSSSTRDHDKSNSLAKSSEGDLKSISNPVSVRVKPGKRNSNSNTATHRHGGAKADDVQSTTRSNAKATLATKPHNENVKSNPRSVSSSVKSGRRSPMRTIHSEDDDTEDDIAASKHGNDDTTSSTKLGINSTKTNSRPVPLGNKSSKRTANETIHSDDDESDHEITTSNGKTTSLAKPSDEFSNYYVSSVSMGVGSGRRDSNASTDSDKDLPSQSLGSVNSTSSTEPSDEMTKSSRSAPWRTKNRSSGKSSMNHGDDDDEYDAHLRRIQKNKIISSNELGLDGGTWHGKSLTGYKDDDDDDDDDSDSSEEIPSTRRSGKSSTGPNIPKPKLAARSSSWQPNYDDSDEGPSARRGGASIRKSWREKRKPNVRNPFYYDSNDDGTPVTKSGTISTTKSLDESTGKVARAVPWRDKRRPILSDEDNKSSDDNSRRLSKRKPRGDIHRDSNAQATPKKAVSMPVSRNVPSTTVNTRPSPTMAPIPSDEDNKSSDDNSGRLSKRKPRGNVHRDSNAQATPKKAISMPISRNVPSTTANARRSPTIAPILSDEEDKKSSDDNSGRLSKRKPRGNVHRDSNAQATPKKAVSMPVSRNVPSTTVNTRSSPTMAPIPSDEDNKSSDDNSGRLSKRKPRGNVHRDSNAQATPKKAISMPISRNVPSTTNAKNSSRKPSPLDFVAQTEKQQQPGQRRKKAAVRRLD